MKYFSFLVLFCCIFCASLTAQHRWGIVAGPNVSSMHGEGDTEIFNEDNSRIGFNVGGIYDLTLNKYLGIQTEVSYTLAGTYGLDMHYVMVPVTFTYAPLSWLKAGIGMQGGILLGSDSNFDHRLFDGGAQAGIEFMLKQNFSIHVRNYFGLAYDHVDSSYYRYLGPEDPLLNADSTYKLNRNNIFQINVRYYFSSGLSNW